ASCFAVAAYLRGATKWSPRLVSRQRLLVFSEALICLSYSGKWLAEPKHGERRLVVPAGKHFRAGTSLPVISRVLVAVCKHLLSYETSSSWGFKPNRRIGRKVTFGWAVARIRVTRLGL